MKSFCKHLLLAATLTLLAVPVLAQSTMDTPDTATKYLMAWSFKDYATMYRLSSEATRKALPQQSFYAAVAAVPIPTSDPKIVSRSNDGGGESIYLQYNTAGGETPSRTSIIMGPDGITHSEVLSHAPAAAAPGGSAGIAVAQLPPVKDSTPAASIDGLTAEDVLSKMQKATEAAETLQADLVIRGSIMGENLNETGKLLYRAPDHIRVQSPKFVLNGTGKETKLFMPQLNSYMDLAGMGGDFELAPGIGTPVSELRQKYNVTLVGKSEIDGVLTYQISLKPPSSGDVSLGAMMGGIGGGAMRMWVSSVTWLPVRAKISSITADYKNMRINAGGIDDSSFVFSPPQGAQELNLGSLLGGLSGGKSGSE